MISQFGTGTVEQLSKRNPSLHLRWKGLRSEARGGGRGFYVSKHGCDADRRAGYASAVLAAVQECHLFGNIGCAVKAVLVDFRRTMSSIERVAIDRGFAETKESVRRWTLEPYFSFQDLGPTSKRAPVLLIFQEMAS
jgi:hypothetical protein